MLQIPVLSTLLAVWSVENIVKVTGKKGKKAVKKTLKATITVKNPSLTLTATSTEVAVGAKETVKATVKPASTKVTFSSSDDAIATVDATTGEVTLDGTTQSVTATEGKVASVGVNKVTIPYATETEIKLVSKDANGVIIDEITYGTQDSSKFDFTLSTSNGYVNGSKLYLNKAGKSFDKVAANKQIAVGEASANFAYFQIKDVDNKEISFYTDYTVESSDNSILMVDDASITDKKAKLTPVKAGTAYLLIKKNNVIVGSVAITVVAEKAVTAMAVDKASVALSTKLGVSGDVIVSFKD